MGDSENADPAKGPSFYESKLDQYLTLHEQKRFKSSLNAKSVESEYNPDNFVKTKNGKNVKSKSKGILQANLDADALLEKKSMSHDEELIPKDLLGESVMF